MVIFQVQKICFSMRMIPMTLYISSVGWYLDNGVLKHFTYNKNIFCKLKKNMFAYKWN